MSSADPSPADAPVADLPPTEPEAARWATIGRPAAELHRLWHEPATLPLVMAHFARVTVRDPHSAHWRVDAPLGRTLEWDTRVTHDVEGQRIAWASVEGGDLPNEGSLAFRPAPGGRGTEVELRVRFDPPGGPVGDALVRLLGLAPKEMLSKALYRFRALAETGEVPTLDRNPAGSGRGRDHQE